MKIGMTPEEWARRVENAVKRQLPVHGRVRDKHGVVHGIIGNYTECDERYAFSDTACCDGFVVVANDTPLTCFECLKYVL